MANGVFSFHSAHISRYRQRCQVLWVDLQVIELTYNAFLCNISCVAGCFISRGVNMSDEIVETSSKRVRSSPYPFYDLEKSIGLMNNIYSQVKLYEVPIEAAVEAMGFSPKGSTGNRAIAALTLFGLLEQTRKNGQRQVKLTDLSRRIILGQEKYGGKGDIKLLQEAALTPNMISYIWGLYSEQGLPSNTVMELKLLNDDNVIVSNTAVDKVILVVRDTLKYAEIEVEESDAQTDIGDELDELQDQDLIEKHKADQHTDTIESTGRGSLEIPYNRSDDPRSDEFRVYTHPFNSGDVTIKIPKRITEEEMDLLQEWIGFMKKTMKH